MAMLQLSPPLPVEHVDGRRGMAHVLIDYSQEHTLLWVVAFDESRELWCVPNGEVRTQDNYSLGREAR